MNDQTNIGLTWPSLVGDDHEGEASCCYRDEITDPLTTWWAGVLWGAIGASLGWWAVMGPWLREVGR